MKLLEIPKHSTNVPVIGFGGAKSQIRHRVKLKISSDYTNFKRDVVTTRVTGQVPSDEKSTSTCDEE